MARLEHPRSVEREALLLFEALAGLDAGTPAHHDLLAGASPKDSAIVAELAAADMGGGSRFSTRFPAAGEGERLPPSSRVGAFPPRRTDRHRRHGQGLARRARRRVV